ncbi:hypothetical protein Tco_1481354 [Tanacetum coccineum]
MAPSLLYAWGKEGIGKSLGNSRIVGNVVLGRSWISGNFGTSAFGRFGSSGLGISGTVGFGISETTGNHRNCGLWKLGNSWLGKLEQSGLKNLRKCRHWNHRNLRLRNNWKFRHSREEGAQLVPEMARD